MTLITERDRNWRSPQTKFSRLDSYMGLNGKLAGFKSLHDEGHLAIIQGVGYPNPNRSHFRSTEIWQTASDANQYASEGWLGRYFDSCCSGADPTVGVAVGDQAPQAFSAKNSNRCDVFTPGTISLASIAEHGRQPISDEEVFYRQLIGKLTETAPVEGNSIAALPGKTQSNISTEDFLRRTALDAQLSSDKILAIARKYKSNMPYPPTPARSRA